MSNLELCYHREDTRRVLGTSTALYRLFLKHYSPTNEGVCTSTAKSTTYVKTHENHDHDDVKRKIREGHDLYLYMRLNMYV